MEYSGTISISIDCDNEEWFNVIDGGMGPTNVTGGSIDLPQGGTRQSRAAATGGVYEAASEAGTGIKSEIDTMIKTLISTDLSDSISSSGLDNISESIAGLEFFYTNLARERVASAASNFADNSDEAKASEQVVESIRVTLTASGFPTMDEIRQEFINRINSILGGM